MRGKLIQSPIAQASKAGTGQVVIVSCHNTIVLSTYIHPPFKGLKEACKTLKFSYNFLKRKHMPFEYKLDIFVFKFERRVK